MNHVSKAKLRPQRASNCRSSSAIHAHFHLDVSKLNLRTSLRHAVSHMSPCRRTLIPQPVAGRKNSIRKLPVRISHSLARLVRVFCLHFGDRIHCSHCARTASRPDWLNSGRRICAHDFRFPIRHSQLEKNESEGRLRWQGPLKKTSFPCPISDAKMTFQIAEMQ